MVVLTEEVKQTMNSAFASGVSYGEMRSQLKALRPSTRRLSLKILTEKMLCENWVSNSGVVISALRLLLNRDISQFDLGFYLNAFSEEPAFGSKVLQLVVYKAKNIRVLTIKYERVDQPSPTQLPFLAKIIQMKNLDQLYIDRFHIKLAEVQQLCRKLANLKWIHVELFPEDPFPESLFSDSKFIDDIRNLEHFIFSSRWTQNEIGDRFQRMLTLSCLRFMSQLKSIGDPVFFVDMSPALEKMATKEYPVDFSFELLMIISQGEKTYDVAKKLFPYLPNVDEFYLKFGPSDKEDSNYADKVLTLAFHNFAGLISVTLYDVAKSGRILQTLANCERDLIFVRLVYDPSVPCEAVDFSFQQLIEKDNNSWRTLYLENIRNFCGENSFSFAKMLSLQFLKIVFEDERSRKPVSLFRILSAPNLKEVTLTDICVTLDDVNYTSKKVERQEILQKLDKFELQICVNESGPNKFQEREAVEQSGGTLVERLQNYRKESTIFFVVL